jgi:hypothetical protein
MRAFLTLIVLAAVAIAVFGFWRVRRAQLREQRRAAWHAKRAEEDRIWRETMGDAATGSGGLGTPRPMGATRPLPGEDKASSGSR